MAPVLTHHVVAIEDLIYVAVLILNADFMRFQITTDLVDLVHSVVKLALGSQLHQFHNIFIEMVQLAFDVIP